MSPEGSPGCRISRGHCSRTESVLGARLIRLGYCFTPGERGVPTHRRVRSHGHDRRSPAPRKRPGDRNRARRRHRLVRLVLILGTIIGATPGATQQNESLRPGVDCLRCPAGRTASTRAPASGRGERPACGVAPGGSMPELAYMGATDDSCTRESSSAYSRSERICDRRLTEPVTFRDELAEEAACGYRQADTVAFVLVMRVRDVPDQAQRASSSSATRSVCPE
jgi:hypothetical protein